MPLTSPTDNLDEKDKTFWMRKIDIQTCSKHSIVSRMILTRSTDFTPPIALTSAKISSRAFWASTKEALSLSGLHLHRHSRATVSNSTPSAMTGPIAVEGRRVVEGVTNAWSFKKRILREAKLYDEKHRMLWKRHDKIIRTTDMRRILPNGTFLVCKNHKFQIKDHALTEAVDARKAAAMEIFILTFSRRNQQESMPRRRRENEGVDGSIRLLHGPLLVNAFGPLQPAKPTS